MSKIVNYKEMIGTKKDKLTIIDAEKKHWTGFKKPVWVIKCECECGNITMIRHTNLVRGLSKSCGCDTALNDKDPRSSNPDILKFFRVAAALVDRCRNPYNRNFPKYGGRGIKCLLGENNFDVAETLSQLSGHFDGAQIDRINNNGNYELGNVRWVTSKVNNKNSISSIPKLSIFDISYRLIPKSRIIKYINKTKYSIHDFKFFAFEHEDIDLSSYVLAVSNKLNESECVEHILSCYSDYGVNLTYKEIDIQHINNE